MEPGLFRIIWFDRNQRLFPGLHRSGWIQFKLKIGNKEINQVFYFYSIWFKELNPGCTKMDGFDQNNAPQCKSDAANRNEFTPNRWEIICTRWKGLIAKQMNLWYFPRQFSEISVNLLIIKWIQNDVKQQQIYKQLHNSTNKRNYAAKLLCDIVLFASESKLRFCLSIQSHFHTKLKIHFHFSF